MNDAQRRAFLQTLWPDDRAPASGVWGILDCARDPKIYRALLESRLEFRCLYSGRLPPLLESHAPHLVELLPSNSLVHRWLDEGWGRAWGVMLRIEDPSNLRPHLRKFLKVTAEDGRRLLFRYYDPRVLRTYLPTCTPTELRLVFGPVSTWWAEGAATDEVIEFSRAGHRLLQRRLEPAAPAASP
jgi:hypothetical protein